jgi:aspartyl-tRNA(Asn)/glutamyl-tRNA(Gln) amidotransferase subunit C
MSIQRREVEQIATLARLDLSPAELESLARDLGSILDHIEELAAVPVEDVKPMEGVGGHPAPMRRDEPGADALHGPARDLAPAWEEGFFLVPRLAALDTDASTELEGAD